MSEQFNFSDDTKRELVIIDESGDVWVRHDIKPLDVAKIIKTMNDRIKRLEEQLIHSKNIHAVLVADVALYEDRGEHIKRLETAGDEMAEELGWGYDVDMWNKAKEAKP